MEKLELINLLEEMIKSVTVVGNYYRNTGDALNEEFYKGQKDGLEMAKYMIQNDQFAEEMKKIYR